MFGTKLRPFCLGHHLLFRRLSLPFSGSPLADAGTEDIMLGVAVCSGESYETTLEQFHSGEWLKEFERWKRQLEGRWPIRRKLTSDFVADAEILFRAYLQDGYSQPPLWEHKSSATEISLSAPWELVLKNRLVMAGYSESEVLNGYLPGRWYDYFAVCELNAAANCNDPKNWRKIFYTKSDYDSLNEGDSR